MGAWITDDGRCEVEIKARIGMAKDALGKCKELLTKNRRKGIKKGVVKALVWSVALYGSETWTLRAEEIRMLQAFDT